MRHVPRLIKVQASVAIPRELTFRKVEWWGNVATEENFTEDILADESATLVRDCLNSLKDGYKNLLILKYEMDLSYKEIARTFGSDGQNLFI